MNNSKNTSSEIDAILIDVRKAYRLLYTFQRRVMDIVQFISNRTLRRYDGGWSKFSNSGPKDGRGNLDQWAWDWLNMYCYEFYLGDKDSVGLSIWLVSDTGYYDSKTDDARNINSFTYVEESATKLVFVAGKVLWHTDFLDFQDNLKKDSSDYIRSNEKGVLLAKSFPLSSFTNGDETSKYLHQFIAFCQTNGITEINASN